MSKRGNTIVEFALVFPFFVFLCVVAFRVGLLGMRQFGWHRLCVRTVRALALGSLTTEPELTAQARALLNKHQPLVFRVDVREVPSRAATTAHRAPKRVELIDLYMEKDSSPFPLRAHVRDVRIRARVSP